MSPKTKNIILGAVTTLATIGYVLLLWRGPWWLDGDHIRDRALQPADGVVITGVRTALVALGAGVVAGLGLYYTHRNHKLSQRQFEHSQEQFHKQHEQTAEQFRLAQEQFTATQARDREQTELSREGQVTGRYVEAIKLLASDNLAERLGGIYSLERIMHDSEKDHGTVVKVLAAYVRQHAPSTEIERDRKVSNGPAMDVQAALTGIALRPNRTEAFEIDLSGVDLSRAVLRDATLHYVDFRKSILTGADMRDAVMLEAVFDDARLDHANLDGADLGGAHLCDAVMDSANMMHADLRHAVATRSSLRGASLNLAKLGEADFGLAKLQGVSFQETDVKMTNFGGADLTGVHVLTVTQFHDAYLDDETKFDSELAGDPMIRARIDECREMF
ncbi:pentapeptide repeat-containing protein [Streptomyces sp. NPDC056721]|uniref:pentapeptide repeat-containing protein n=1 Tax=Streptomyces sp. NPDC056721 TaxID=3345923 RepID=UPI00369351A8